MHKGVPSDVCKRKVGEGGIGAWPDRNVEIIPVVTFLTPLA